MEGSESAPPPPLHPPAAEAPAENGSGSESEARRLKSLAEEKFRCSALKPALRYARRALRLAPDLDGLSALVTALKILRASPSDHYKILRLDPFSPPSIIKKQYKTLALALHPDKSGGPAAGDGGEALIPAAEEAFKRVADSFRFLSDKSLKKKFDADLRISLAAQKSSSLAATDGPIETFWTSCATCRLLHEFDRRYLGHRLVCPSCQKSFLAAEVEVTANGDGGGEEEASVRVRVRAARSRSRARPRVPSGWGSLAAPESKRPRLRREKTLAEIQMELTNAKKKGKGKEKAIVSVRNKDDDFSVMAVEDSDFYDFDQDRTEKSFGKGQVWAVYDDDDGMPRHYGLIEEVKSSSPFRVKMSWLDLKNSGDEALIMWEKSGHHISCGRFKVGRKVDIDSVNFFSHLVYCERAAREVYRIYPKKGSVWALYGESALEGEEERVYDIVVFLTSYSEMYGLSMSYLEKVEGYKTVFKRKEVGAHAVKWVEKDDVRLFSHQIPARKLLGEEDENLPLECWELDPASLPAGLLRIDSGR